MPKRKRSKEEKTKQQPVMTMEIARQELALTNRVFTADGIQRRSEAFLCRQLHECGGNFIAELRHQTRHGPPNQTAPYYFKSRPIISSGPAPRTLHLGKLLGHVIEPDVMMIWNVTIPPLGSMRLISWMGDNPHMLESPELFKMKQQNTSIIATGLWRRIHLDTNNELEEKVFVVRRSDQDWSNLVKIEQLLLSLMIRLPIELIRLMISYCIVLK